VSKLQLQGAITSISLDAKGKQDLNTLAYVGSNTGNMYQIVVNLQTGEFHQQLVQSAHPASVTAVAFAEMYGEVRPRKFRSKDECDWNVHCRRIG
jgi:hypothetical protein